MTNDMANDFSDFLKETFRFYLFHGSLWIRVWDEEKETGGMPEIPAPPYQRLYTGYRYAGDATPKTASMDYHGRPLEPVITSCLEEGQTEMTLCNSGLRVSQIAPKVPEQGPFSTAGQIRRANREPLRPHQIPMISDRSEIDSERFACLL